MFESWPDGCPPLHLYISTITGNTSPSAYFLKVEVHLLTSFPKGGPKFCILNSGGNFLLLSPLSSLGREMSQKGWQGVSSRKAGPVRFYPLLYHQHLAEGPAPCRATWRRRKEVPGSLPSCAEYPHSLAQTTQPPWEVGTTSTPILRMDKLRPSGERKVPPASMGGAGFRAHDFKSVVSFRR